MKKVLIVLSLSIFFGITLFSSTITKSDIKQEPNVYETMTIKIRTIKPKVVKKEKKSIVEENSGVFVGVSAGFSKYEVQENDILGTVVLNPGAKDAATTYGLELGYYFNDYIFSTINYQKSILQNAKFNYLFSSINLELTHLKLLSPYFGLIAGVNVMQWEKSSLSSIAKYPTNYSFFVGGQVGEDIPLSKSFSLYICYRYLTINNKTVVESASAKKEVTYKDEQSLNLGLRYSF